MSILRVKCWTVVPCVQRRLLVLRPYGDDWKESVVLENDLTVSEQLNEHLARHGDILARKVIRYGR